MTISKLVKANIKIKPIHITNNINLTKDMKESKKTTFKIGDKLELIKTDRVKQGYSNNSLKAVYGVIQEIRKEDSQYKVQLVFDNGDIDYGYCWNFDDVKLLKTKNKLFDYDQY